MSSLRDKYKSYFQAPADGNGPDVEMLRHVQAAAPFIEKYKQRIYKLAENKRWQSGMTQEQAAQNLIAQSVYLDMIQELDRMMRAATEQISG